MTAAAFAVLEFPTSAPPGLLLDPWQATVYVEPAGIVVMFKRDKGEFRAYVAQQGARIQWGAQRRDGALCIEGQARDLAEAHRRATERLDDLAAGTTGTVH